MTLFNYTDPIPLPPPTASATTVSYTDPLGDVWVAKASVNGGNWFRARDVLHARWWRSAAYSLTTGAISIPYDTSVYDAYSLYSTGTTLFTAPVAGQYDLRVTTLATATAASQYLIVRIAVGGTVVAQGQIYTAVAGAYTINSFTAFNLNVGSTVMMQSYSSVALALNTGAQYSFAEFHYVGTG